jgi:hypothetical protein
MTKLGFRLLNTGRECHNLENNSMKHEKHQTKFEGGEGKERREEKGHEEDKGTY